MRDENLNVNDFSSALCSKRRNFHHVTLGCIKNRFSVGAAFFIEKIFFEEIFPDVKRKKSLFEGDRREGNIIIEVKLAKIFHLMSMKSGLAHIKRGQESFSLFRDTKI